MTWQTHSVLASPSLPEMAWTYAYFNHMVHTQVGALSWLIMVSCMHWIHDPVSNQMNDTFGPCMSMCWWHPAHHTKVQEANAGVSRYLGLSFSHEFTAQDDGLPILKLHKLDLPKWVRKRIVWPGTAFLFDSFQRGILPGCFTFPLLRKIIHGSGRSNKSHPALLMMCRLNWNVPSGKLT